ncbi:MULTISPECIES: YeeE/YedE family protein [Comamonas]|uniref:YeeE/YedE family protein n=1 Tax=Comamonas TaxID=283 RepID=UPI002113302A|nr:MULTISPECIES: YeeE/YedE family protein [Comamonas]UUC91656.1 YeeE/YedE family protein [Comamonas sp. C11]WEE75563.1 YeeE/YedE family protein [Comamonas testosteroni]
MRNRISEFAIGLVFGLGLIISGMTDPGKVLGFLDLAGLWDPSLALVMGGAVLVGLFAFTLARKRSTSVLGGPMQLPTARQIDRRLVLGSLAFGVGWGIAGFCPGPAIVSLGAGEPKAVVFVLAMLAGMGAFEWLEMRKTARSAPHVA